MINVLITGAGTITANNVIKALREDRNIKIVSTDINQRRFVSGAYFSDEFYQVPFGVDKRFIPKLLGIVKKEKIDVVIPIIDEEFIPIVGNIIKFENQGAKVLISNLNTIEICTDKYRTFLFFKQNHILTAPTFLPSQISLIKNSDFPVIVKPRSGRASIGIVKAYDKQGLASILNHNNNVVIQKFIKGEEFTIDVLADLNYAVKTAIPRRRVEVKSGVSYKGVTVNDQCLIKQAVSITEKLRIFGPANLQAIKTKDKYYFIEVNPRFSGGLALSVAAGVNIPLLAVDAVLGKKIVSSFKFKAGLNMIRYVNEKFFPDR
ncbi:MAG: ATP-grasp domain-containing protein [Candidatus Omnitrophica bacterium]|jgi:carbamoyl-phosphate synthase large subunit|nr:ATP-grasp domain-containing protein [Candidatus Omnitrophota bacterium]